MYGVGDIDTLPSYVCKELNCFTYFKFETVNHPSTPPTTRERSSDFPLPSPSSISSSFVSPVDRGIRNYEGGLISSTLYLNFVQFYLRVHNRSFVGMRQKNSIWPKDNFLEKEKMCIQCITSTYTKSGLSCKTL